MESVGYHKEQHWSHDGLPVERDTARGNGTSICLLGKIRDPDQCQNVGREEGSGSEQGLDGVGRCLKASCCFLKVQEVGMVSGGNFLKIGISKHWQRFPRELLESPSLEH